MAKYEMFSVDRAPLHKSYGRMQGDPKYITIHNTANRASARNEANYAAYGSGEVSYHYAVDDKEVWNIMPLESTAWHAGDGRGDGNTRSIGIEICYSLDVGDKRYPIAEDNASYLSAKLLKQFGLGVDRLRKHQDWTGKYCPHRMLDNGGWGAFKARTQKYLDEMNGVVEQAPVVPAIPVVSDNILWRVQVGAFREKFRMDNLALELIKNGYKTHRVTADGYFKVQVGAFENKSNATNLADKLKSEGYATFITDKAGVPVVSDTKVPTVEVATPVKEGDRIRILRGAVDLNTRGTFAGFVYDTIYIALEVKPTYVVFGTAPERYTGKVKVGDVRKA